MSSSDNYIVITGSRNLDSGDRDSDGLELEEGDEASLQTLENQGISIIKDEDLPAKGEPRDQLSRELMDEGGIEIISGEEEEAFL